MSNDYLLENVELSFKLYEFSIRTMCYSELNKIDPDVFGQELQINLDEENICFSDDLFKDKNEIIKISQMNVGATFAATAICLDCLLEGKKDTPSNIVSAGKIVSAVRNAFSHGIASPAWFIKPHRKESIDLSFVNGPVIDLGALNGKDFDYSQLGGMAVWYRLKDEIVSHIKNNTP